MSILKLGYKYISLIRYINFILIIGIWVVNYLWIQRSRWVHNPKTGFSVPGPVQNAQNDCKGNKYQKIFIFLQPGLFYFWLIQIKSHITKLKGGEIGTVLHWKPAQLSALLSSLQLTNFWLCYLDICYLYILLFIFPLTFTTRF